MKVPHLLRVAQGAEIFAPLFAAADALGLKLGWLEFPEGPQPAPPTLAEAAGQGARRAVAVGQGGSIALKPRKGEPVLRDLLREHFLGCALVLIAGDMPAPEKLCTLEPQGEGWVVKGEGSVRHFSTEELARALRKARPWEHGHTD